MGKLYSLISALLLTVCVAFAAVPDSYEWWFDHDVSSAQKGSLSGKALDLDIDTSDLPKGIHYFNLRLAEGDSVYGAVYRKLFHAYGSDSKAISYEYWYDNDYDEKVTGDISKGSSSFDLDVSSLPKGTHYFNCRLVYGDGSWGAVYRRMFHTVGADSGVISYEYWYDNDYDAKVSGAIDVGSNHFELDLSNLPSGAHYYNIRLGYGDGSWGSVYRKMVLNLAGSVNAVAYEYWIDNDYSAKIEGSLAPGANSYEIDLMGVRRGLHRFNYRVKTGEGIWGAPFTSYFYSESNASRFTEYEYWLDNDYANRVSGNATGNPASFEVDLSAFDKSGGAHYFNLRTRDGDGDWSPIYHKLIVFNKTEKRQPIIGYRHYINGTHLGYVEVERQIVDSYMFDINLPDSLYPSVKNRKPIFDGDKVSVADADSIDYVMQIRTELGWSIPQEWKMELKNDFSTTAVEMKVNTKQTFASPSGLEFAAVKFISSGDPLYFRSDVPVALDIYKDGERVEAIAPAQLKGMTMLQLEEEEYFGILYGVEDSEAKNFTLHLMDTPNIVPMPEISFEDGVVTMTCIRSDAEIRYTLNKTIPTMESTLYEGPFTLSHNATVWAIAYIPNSDIEPSEIAELVVDSYKTATPTGNFDYESGRLTLQCATEGAAISYALDAPENWIAYVSPIEISGNCTVYAKAIANGYNESEMLIMEIGQFRCNPVDISYNGRYVTMKTDDPQAEIIYSVVLPDGVITVENEVYTGQIDVKTLCHVSAKAVREGYQDTEVSDYSINCYGDENHAETNAGGLLKSSYGWCGSELLNGIIDEFSVEGSLNDEDYSFLRSMAGLRHLDISKVADARIPDNAFKGSRLISISLPAEITEYGDSILSEAQDLCSVIWNSDLMNVEARLLKGIANPNALIYVPAGISVEDSSELNVVEGNDASSIILRDGFPFYVARAFTAADISYSRNFEMETLFEISAGWETIVLPFSPEIISHETAGEIIPFAKWNGDTSDGPKPFWLYRSDSDDWKEADRIEAGVPYIISMPNNADYVASFNLNGKVTFSANRVQLTPEINLLKATPWVNGTLFEGTFLRVEEEGLLSLNVNSKEYGVNPGSAFVEDDVTLPFGAYVRNAGTKKFMPLFGNYETIQLPSLGAGLTIVSPAPGVLSVSSNRECNVDVITATGVRLHSFHLMPGETQTLEGLTRDLYIVAGRKVMVK
ncbi:MAG: chitobiase/beta-hexosaminidase C-terminal domain-containing protein [Muribaculaceae bacterium]|nr:chitobiase/beta-hexosaminidase C-terminal domain-containing protein [Muribaculaceae bacterium]